jgi:hypothetical protein
MEAFEFGMGANLEIGATGGARTNRQVSVGISSLGISISLTLEIQTTNWTRHLFNWQGQSGCKVKPCGTSHATKIGP